MPGPAMHHMIADRIRSHIQQGYGLGHNLQPEQYDQLRHLLNDPKNLPYLFLGCQGPDFFFLNTKDINSTLGGIVELYYDVYDFIHDFKETLVSIVPDPVLDALAAYDKAVDTLIEDSALLSELKQTFEDTSRVVNGLVSTLTEKVKKFITEFNIFETMEHPYRDGVSNPDGTWRWFDALHYRKTGKFVKAMLDATADMQSPMHLYAVGYLTHIAADTVGHPYVNINSGGPYRSHAQRHKTAENYQDVFNFSNEKLNDFNRSKLHEFYNFNFRGIIDDQEIDLNTNLPNDLAQLIASTINQIYQEDADLTVEYGKTLTAEDINNTYRIWYQWFRNVTDTGTIPEPVAYSFTKELREVWEKAIDNLGDAGEFLQNSIGKSGKFGILSIFIILGAAIIAAGMAAAAIADGIAGAITTVGTSTIRATACLIYEHIYDAFQNFRLGVACNGLAFPMQEHLNDPRFRQFANPSYPDNTGVNAQNIGQFLPRRKWDVPFGSDPVGAIFHQDRHLIYPITDFERPHVVAAPESYFDKPAVFYAWGDIPSNAQVIDRLLKLTVQSDVVSHDNGGLLQNIIKEYGLGNALELSKNLYSNCMSGGQIPDFNLDGDRGLGYLCWVQLSETSSGLTPEKEDFPQPIDEFPQIELRFIG